MISHLTTSHEAIHSLDILINSRPLISPELLQPAARSEQTTVKMNQDKAEQNMDKFYKSYGKQGYDHMSNKVFDMMRLISGPLAINMLKQVGLDENTTEPFSLLDNGAGTGIVSAELQRMANPAVLAQSKIVSADSTEGMVEVMKRRAVEEGWVNTESRVIDSQVSTSTVTICVLSTFRGSDKRIIEHTRARCNVYTRHSQHNAACGARFGKGPQR